MKGHSVLLADLTISIVSHNRLSELESGLRAIAEPAAEHGAELVIVDNGSTDGASEYVQHLQTAFPRTKTLYLDTNRGVAGGRNAVLTLATRPYLLSLDDDASLSSDGMVAMLDAIRLGENIGILSPRIRHAVTLAPQLDLGDASASIANFHGACYLARRELMLGIGGYDDK
jgi:GT2 family glycosyltransferase